MDLIKNSGENHSDSNEMKLRELPNNIVDMIELNGLDLICINDFSGKIFYVSESVRKLIGYRKRQVIGKNVFRYILREDQNFLISYIKHPTSPQKTFHVHVRNQFGQFITFETVLQIVELNGEKSVLSLSRDISDKKQAEEMLIRSEKMSIAGQLAAGIAHEIRNPLTSLNGFIQLLQAGMENKDEYYQIMVEEIEKINTITSELLYISKPMTEDKKAESVVDMIKDVRTLLNTQAKLYDIELLLKITEDHNVFCDRSQLKQVFINLIKNAIEEMQDGGTIVIQIEGSYCNCEIAIIDQGPGIPQHVIHKLKEPFFTTKKSGTGLGLMISNQIIENHNGKLNIESIEGVGSTFCVNLPIYNQ